MTSNNLFFVLIVAATTAYLGCDTEAEVFDADALEEADGGGPQLEDQALAQAKRPSRAASFDRLNSCEWQRESTSTDQFLYVECVDSYKRPLTGGCYNSSKLSPLTADHPFENGSLDLPEDGELWWATDGIDAGWRCEKDGTNGTLWGMALCCGTAPPP